MKRLRIRITGKVQGVWFRESTRMEAERLGLVGFVENLPDGRVQIVAQGPNHMVDALVSWSQQGPRAANVEEVQVHAEGLSSAYEMFMVRR
jgi:acylphosphatase